MRKSVWGPGRVANMEKRSLHNLRMFFGASESLPVMGMPRPCPLRPAYVTWRSFPSHQLLTWQDRPVGRKSTCSLVKGIGS